nr:helix-turn-helix domain-containing protein [Bacteroides sp. GM023]
MKNELTFNDLPMVVKELCNKVESLEETLLKQVTNRSAPMYENSHTPMTSEEAREYLKMPKSTFYFKVGNGEIPAVKQGKRYYLYKDELDQWLETGRKNAPVLSAEETNAAILASHKRKPNTTNY